MNKRIRIIGGIVLIALVLAGASAFIMHTSQISEPDRSQEMPGVTVRLKKAVGPEGQLYRGSSFTVSGKIKASIPIRSVKLGAVDANGEWCAGASYENDEVNSRKFDIHEEAGRHMKFGKLAAGTYTYRVMAALENGSEHTLMEQPFEVIEVSDEEAEVTRGARKICRMARNCAWPFGTPEKVYKYKGGHPTDAFKKAIRTAYPDRSSWGAMPRAGASCDVFVGTCVRASGYDKGFPRGLDEVMSHIDQNPQLWEKHRDLTTADEMRPGDIIFIRWGPNGAGYGHIMIYLGDSRISNAYYGSNGRYGIIVDAGGLIGRGSGYGDLGKIFVFRPVR